MEYVRICVNMNKELLGVLDQELKRRDVYSINRSREINKAVEKHLKDSMGIRFHIKKRQEKIKNESNKEN